MKMHNTLARRAVLAALQMSITMALTGCAAAVQVLAPVGDGAELQTKALPAIPPGQRLEKFTLCYELRRPRASPLEAPVKRFLIEVSLLVPQDDCLALDANGWLSVVPGQCTRMSAQSACEEKP
ncbi:hypothetical protein [Polaromonas sp. LjRoot131]|uniref:hypothetical protein n=1 Tax=Polaromonas sp. LjRoot131 TaxID=3342262 RepID=UPI003ECFB8AE